VAEWFKAPVVLKTDAFDSFLFRSVPACVDLFVEFEIVAVLVHVSTNQCYPVGSKSVAVCSSVVPSPAHALPLGRHGSMKPGGPRAGPRLLLRRASSRTTDNAAATMTDDQCHTYPY
jgi:hypothetical protein